VTFDDVLPDISVTKTANPTSVPETGGNVTFTFVVTNDGAEDVTLTSLTDTVFGDLNGQGSCVLPQTIAAGGSYSCSLTALLTGSDAIVQSLALDTIIRPFCIEPPAPHYNVVTAMAVDNEGAQDTDEDDATVTFDEVAPAIEVSKTANPTSVPATGGNVTFTIKVKNAGTEPVTLTGAVDTVFGPIDVGLFDKTYLEAGQYAIYSFTEWLAGDPATPHKNVVTVTAANNQGTQVTDSDDAKVTFTETPPPAKVYHVYFDKVWVDANMNPTAAPALPGNFTITATSSVGQATCTWSGGSLVCLYQNQMPPALDNNGLWVPDGESYTVSEAGLPTGWYGIQGIGTFPANSGNCDGTTCLHTVKNQLSTGGRVVVTKTVDWSGAQPNPNQKFEFCIFGPSFVSPSYSCKSVGPNGGTVVWDNLLPGKYDVVESPLGTDWTVVTSRIQKAVITGANTVELAFVNRYNAEVEEPKLVVESTCDIQTGQVKFTLTNTGADMSAGVPYTISNDTGVIASGTTNALGTGESQIFQPLIQIGGGTMVFETTGAGGLYARAEVEECFKPSEPLGRVEVTKTVDWNGAQPDPNQTFEFCIFGPSYPNGDCQTVGPNGGTVVWDNLEPGLYGIAESPLDAIWIVVTPRIQNARIVGGDIIRLGFTNRYDYQVEEPYLVVQGTCDSQTGQVKFTLTNTGDPMAAGVPYTIANATGTIASGTTNALGKGESQTFQPPIAIGGGKMIFETSGAGGLYARAEVEECFVPVEPLGRIKVIKTVDWSGAQLDPNQTFEFCIFGPSFISPSYDCQTVGPNGGTVEWDNLVPGNYVVVETPLDTIWIVVTGRIQKATIVGGDMVELGFTNRYNLPPPDSDGDGLADKVDACPNKGASSYGLSATGCPLPPPDSDGDGLTDNVDVCPNKGASSYGLFATGCPLPPPDSDGDGLADDADECQYEGASSYGLSATGCPLPPPDSDGDGLADDVDACRNEGASSYGLSATGCPLPPPDSDGDGLADDVDACRNEGASSYGLSATGCPLPPPDSDGDGLADDVDECRDQGNQGYGLTEKGCPLPPPPPPADTDGDGLADGVDECPDQGNQGYGLTEKGCPLSPPPPPEGAGEGEGEGDVE